MRCVSLGNNNVHVKGQNDLEVKLFDVTRSQKLTEPLTSTQGQAFQMFDNPLGKNTKCRRRSLKACLFWATVEVLRKSGPAPYVDIKSSF